MPEEIRQEEQFDLRSYIQVLLNRKWLILGFTVALTVAVGIGTSLQRKLYEARVTLLAGQEGPRLLAADPIPGERSGQRDYLRTQAAILTSRSLIQGAVRHLMEQGFYGDVAPDRVEATAAELAKDIQGRTRTLTAENSQVIAVCVAGASPDRIARIANAIADEYVETNQESRVAMANQAVAWLTAKLAEQKIKLTEAEEDLRAFKEKENIVAADDADPFATLSLSRLNDEYLTTRFQRMERESRLATMKRNREARSAQGSATGSLDAEIQRRVRESLEADYIKAQVDLRNLSERYGPEHPDYITLKGKVEKIAKELETLEQPGAPAEAPAPVTGAQIADLEAEVSVLHQKEAALSQALDAQKAQARNLSRTAVGYSLRKQAVDLNRQTYNDLLVRLNDAQLSGQIRSTAVRVLDRAEPPRSPIEPQPARNLMVAVALGLVLGIGLALLLETLDRRVKSPEEAARYLRLPILTVVPGIGLGKGVGREEGKATLVTIAQPRSHAAECYRNLRTSILFSTGRPVPKTILVTSAVGGEGKSTTASNLAVVLTQSGRRVLLIDADLRRPALQRYFERQKNRGIVRLLGGDCAPEEAVQRSFIENLDLLLCPSVPANPSELLGSDRMVGVIEHFKSRYDVVVIDSPVIISIPDTLILASRAESVIMVHRPGAADRGMVRYAREKLDEVKANILGLVLNNVDLRKGAYHYPTYSYYGYGTEETTGPQGLAGEEGVKLIIQIPCLNEEATLPATLSGLPRSLPGVDEVEVLVVDDGSTDGTAEVARRMGVDHLVVLPRHQGLAGAFRVGLETSLMRGADIIVNTDADNQYDARDLGRLVQPILEGRADMVVGDRRVQGIRHFSALKKLLHRVGDRVMERLSGIELLDSTSGFRAYSREAALRLNVFSTFTYTLETLIQAGKKNLVVAHVPVRVNEKLRESRLFPGLWFYLKRSASTMVRIYAMYEPLKFFSYLGALVGGIGAVLLLRFLYYFLTSQVPVGRLQSLLTGGTLLGMGLMLGLIGVVSDLMAVNRRLAEDIQYRIRRMELRAPIDERERAEGPAPASQGPTVVAGRKP